MTDNEIIAAAIKRRDNRRKKMTLKHETRQTQSKTSRTLITLVGTGLAFRSDKSETAQTWESKQGAVAFAKTLGFSAKHVCAAWLNRFSWGWIIRGELDDVYCQDGQMRLPQ
jgi:hypothetical protein